MDAVGALYELGEGRFEWANGRAVELPPPSVVECRLRFFIAALFDAFTEERHGGQVLFGGYVQRLEQETVRVPDVAYVRS